MTNKRKRRARSLSAKTGMSYQAAINVLAAKQTPPEPEGHISYDAILEAVDPDFHKKFETAMQYSLRETLAKIGIIDEDPARERALKPFRSFRDLPPAKEDTFTALGIGPEDVSRIRQLAEVDKRKAFEYETEPADILWGRLPPPPPMWPAISNEDADEILKAGFEIEVPPEELTAEAREARRLQIEREIQARDEEIRRRDQGLDYARVAPEFIPDIAFMAERERQLAEAQAAMRALEEQRLQEDPDRYKAYLKWVPGPEDPYSGHWVPIEDAEEGR